MDAGMSDRYELVDPRPIAPSARYTYFLPTAERLEAIGPGDLVKVTMRAVPSSEKWDAERMWVQILSVETAWLEGTLESQPDDMPGVVKGIIVCLPRTYVMDIIFVDPERRATIPPDPRREFWERCLVDQAVLDGEIPVHYLYREEPNQTRDGDEFPDSGWRIRGDLRGVSAEQIAERQVAYVALGAVLNRDDSWLALIDEPAGSAYERDFDRGVFIRLGE